MEWHEMNDECIKWSWKRMIMNNEGSKYRLKYLDM